MDGVLVDNIPVHLEAFDEFCRRYGVNDYREKILATSGMGNDDIMRLILPPQIIERVGLDALAAEKEALYREIYTDRIRPVEGLPQFLESLAAAGIRCAVGSSGCRENIDFVLSRCGIGRYFSSITGGDMVSHCKPDPEIYLTAAAALGLRADECVVIEDALVGIAAAHNAAMKVIGITTTLSAERLSAAGVAAVIDDFTQLSPEYLLSL